MSISNKIIENLNLIGFIFVNFFNLNLWGELALIVGVKTGVGVDGSGIATWEIGFFGLVDSNSHIRVKKILIKFFDQKMIAEKSVKIFDP